MPTTQELLGRQDVKATLACADMHGRRAKGVKFPWMSDRGTARTHAGLVCVLRHVHIKGLPDD